MAKKNISKVLTNPDLIAANNPQYGGEVVPNTTNVVGTPVGSAVVTPQGNVPVQQTVQPQTQVVQPQQAVKPVPNLFKLTPEQQASMTYTDKELEAGHHLVGERAKVQPQTTPTVQGGGFTVSDVKSRPQITSMDELAAALDYTTPEQEEKLRKASVNNQRILAVADALRHIGNIANTVNYAPAQQFNQPWAEEQARYEKGKAQRDAANATYRAYVRQREDQARAERKLDAQIQKQEADTARADRLNEAKMARLQQQNAKDDSWAKYYETKARLLEEGWPLEKANKEAQIALRKEQTRLAGIKADQGGFAPKKGSSGGGRRGGSGGRGTDEWDRTTTVTINRDKNGKELSRTTSTQKRYKNRKYTDNRDKNGKKIIHW